MGNSCKKCMNIPWTHSRMRAPTFNKLTCTRTCINIPSINQYTCMRECTRKVHHFTWLDRHLRSSTDGIVHLRAKPVGTAESVWSKSALCARRSLIHSWVHLYATILERCLTCAVGAGQLVEATQQHEDVVDD